MTFLYEPIRNCQLILRDVNRKIYDLRRVILADISDIPINNNINNYYEYLGLPKLKPKQSGINISRKYYQVKSPFFALI